MPATQRTKKDIIEELGTAKASLRYFAKKEKRDGGLSDVLKKKRAARQAEVKKLEKMLKDMGVEAPKLDKPATKGGKTKKAKKGKAKPKEDEKPKGWWGRLKRRLNPTEDDLKKRLKDERKKTRKARLKKDIRREKRKRREYGGQERPKATAFGPGAGKKPPSMFGGGGERPRSETPPSMFGMGGSKGKGKKKHKPMFGW